jgi:hypothetical protein
MALIHRFNNDTELPISQPSAYFHPPVLSALSFDPYTHAPGGGNKFEQPSCYTKLFD